MVQFEVYLIKACLKQYCCSQVQFIAPGLNFDKILLNKNIQKRIVIIYNNNIAAARVELWSSSTSAKYAESCSANYILCEKQRKYKCSFFKKKMLLYVVCHVFIVDIMFRLTFKMHYILIFAFTYHE